MTNAEKFREVFGIEIDENPIDPCDMFHNSICTNHECSNCPAWHFWEKEYLAEGEDKVYENIK